METALAQRVDGTSSSVEGGCHSINLVRTKYLGLGLPVLLRSVGLNRMGEGDQAFSLRRGVTGQGRMRRIAAVFCPILSRLCTFVLGSSYIYL